MSLTAAEFEERWNRIMLGIPHPIPGISVGRDAPLPVTIHTFASDLYERVGAVSISYNPFPRFHLWRFWR